jgi:hypothetical protein
MLLPGGLRAARKRLSQLEEDWHANFKSLRVLLSPRLCVPRVKCRDMEQEGFV